MCVLAEGLICHVTPEYLKVIYAWALATFVKGLKIRLHKNWMSVLPERKVPQRRNCRWCDELISNYDGYGLCWVRHGLCTQQFVNEWACITFLFTNGLWKSCYSITWSGIGNGIGVAASWRGDGIHVVGYRVGLSVVGWGGAKRWDASYTRHKPILPIIINHKFTRPSAISTLGEFSLSQNGQPNLAQPNFHTLNKSRQGSPEHKLFSDLFSVIW